MNTISTLSAKLLGLTENFLDAEVWLVAHCATAHERGEIGSFFVSGREGIPLAPDDFFPNYFLNYDIDDDREK